MITVINDFEDKVKEIELYFDYLTLLDKQPSLNFGITKKQKAVDVEFIKVLKASCFLILYNLMESCIRQSLNEIYEQISARNLKYSTVKDEIKKIWIASKHKNFTSKSNDDIFAIIQALADEIIEITFEESKGFGGNIDQTKIWKLGDKIGFSIKTHYKLKDGSKLHEVKTKRNSLAHGLESFSTCGKNYSVDDLIRTKNQVIKYLRAILKNIESFLKKEEFKI